jgi:hypothetical protein
MWRHFDEPRVLSAALESLRTQTRGARPSRRRRLQVADGLCRVARYAAPGARQRRHELLLISRAAAVRPALLEVAALVRCSTDPDPECIADLHTLLSSGCDSPLYNRTVPAEHLEATLDRACAALTHPHASRNPTDIPRGRLDRRPT